MVTNPFKSVEREHELVLSGEYAVARLDMENGRHVCKLHVQPYDPVFLDSVIDTFKALVHFLPDVVGGYVNSDEISLIWPTATRWQKNRILKVCSILASYAGKELNNAYRSRIRPDSVYETTMNHLYFDCRAFSLGEPDLVPYLQSRQNLIVYGNLHWKAKQFTRDSIVQRHRSESAKRALLEHLGQSFENDPSRFSYGVLYTRRAGFNEAVGDFRRCSVNLF